MVSDSLLYRHQANRCLYPVIWIDHQDQKLAYQDSISVPPVTPQRLRTDPRITTCGGTLVALQKILHRQSGVLRRDI